MLYINIEMLSKLFQDNFSKNNEINYERSNGAVLRCQNFSRIIFSRDMSKLTKKIESFI